MSLEYKAVAVNGFKVLDEEKGVISTVVSVTGIKDNVNDNIHPGSYAKTLKARIPKGVWSHAWETPVSKTLAIKELMPLDPALPKKLSNGKDWPQEAGGLLVKTQFNLGTQRGREAYSDVMFYGDQQEWSIGYRVPPGTAEIDNETGVRNIKELELYEYSPVLFGAMPHARSQGVKSVRDAQTEYKHWLENSDEEATDEWSSEKKEDKPVARKPVPAMPGTKLASREGLLALKVVIDNLLETKDVDAGDVDLFEFSDELDDTETDDADDVEVDDESDEEDDEDTDEDEEKSVMHAVIENLDPKCTSYKRLIYAASGYDSDPSEENAIKVLDLLEAEQKSDPEGVAAIATVLMDEAKSANNESAEDEEDDDEEANDESSDQDTEDDVTDEDEDGDDTQKARTAKKSLAALKDLPEFKAIKAAVDAKDGQALAGLLSTVVTDTDDVKVLEAATELLDSAQHAVKQVSWIDGYYQKSDISTTPWSNFSAADYSDEQYKSACLIAGATKSDSHLPIKEPNGKLNKNGVIAAAGRLNQTKGISDEQRKSAAKKLVSLYRNQLQMDPPESLLSMAGDDGKKEFDVQEEFDTKSLEELLDDAMIGVFGDES